MNLETRYPQPTKGRIVVWGLLGVMPFGGMIWQVLHHLAGFRRLGFDVWYVEDTYRICMDPENWEEISDYETTARFLNDTLSMIGLEDRWVYRPKSEIAFGCLSASRLRDLYSEVDAVFNVCSGVWPRPEHDVIRCLVLLQTDPVGSQIQIASGNQRLIERVSKHDFQFTYGENIGRPGNPIPVRHFDWIPTRPPIVTDWWNNGGSVSRNARFTTIANWRNNNRSLEWDGERYYWEKHMEFEKVKNLPSRTNAEFELSLVGMRDDERSQMENLGWKIADAKQLSRADHYRNYILGSLGEFTVAKDQNVRMKSGWFSDRSACYLAAGKPVVTQDTGFGTVFPTGRGLFAFHDEQEAIDAVETILVDYEEHSAAARELACEYFEAEKVLGDVCRRIGLR